MFGFNKKDSAPRLCPGNPGTGTEVQIAFSSGRRTWNEKANLLRIASDVLKRHGHSVVEEQTGLRHADSGFLLLPRIFRVQPSEQGSVQTTTTLQINHPTLAPDGIFEYQHATGSNLTESLSQGFDLWMQTDFVPLLDALRPQPESCMVLEMTFPMENSNSERVRRAVLGPVAHYRQNPPTTMENNRPEDHDFCPCCLLTRSFEAFRELFEGDALYCLRLFASRDTERIPAADCRVNGEDWEKGALALRQYALTWPSAGYEFRKQYVILQSLGNRPAR